MSIFDKRTVYKPFEYEWAFDYALVHHQAHWLHTEIPMASDISDWNSKLSDRERHLIGNILKGFTQAEIIVGDYWSSKVTKWFPKPEICLMASAFSGREGIHQMGYAHLNDSLGLDNYSEFLEDEATMKKLNSYIIPDDETEENKARSIAIFSGFAEGVHLFSSFAVLLSFQTRNLLKGVGQVVSWSVRDESQHSDAGCKIFRQIMKEKPHIWTDDFKATIYQAARDAVRLEDDFLDMVFEEGNIPLKITETDGYRNIELTPYMMKQFIRHRANTKLGDLGLKMNWKNLNQESLDDMAWFDNLTAATNHQDFFAGRVTDYSKGHKDFSKIWEDE